MKRYRVRERIYCIDDDSRATIAIAVGTHVEVESLQDGDIVLRWVDEAARVREQRIARILWDTYVQSSLEPM